MESKKKKKKKTSIQPIKPNQIKETHVFREQMSSCQKGAGTRTVEEIGEGD